MEIKKLIWRDNVTEFGKSCGMFEILSNVDRLNISYIIRNYKYFDDTCYSDKYYFFSESDSDEYVECATIEEAKEKAQEHFKKTIINLFFI